MTFTMPRFRERALCAEVDPDLFYPEKGGSSAPAKRICNGDKNHAPCPAKAECLIWALAHVEAGVWAGLSELERKRIAGYRPECGSPKGYNAGRIRDYRQERRRVS